MPEGRVLDIELNTIAKKRWFWDRVVFLETWIHDQDTFDEMIRVAAARCGKNVNPWDLLHAMEQIIEETVRSTDPEADYAR